MISIYNKLSFLFLASFWLLFTPVGLAQEHADITGLSKITHYTKADYGIETQFWAMAEDDDGVIYFGTNWGISILNGQQWLSVEIPKGSEVRALHQTRDNRIIVGGYNEIGEIKKDEFGQYYYVSLLDLMANEEIDFDFIWQIESIDNLLIFRSFTKLILLLENKVTVIPTNNIFWSANIIDDQIIVSSAEDLFILDRDSQKLELIVNADGYNQERIVAVLPYKSGSALVFTRVGNSYLLDYRNKTIVLDKQHFESSNHDQIFCATRSSDGRYLLGTINSYMKYYDPENPESNQFRSDLQDKTVLHIFESKNGNTWTLLNRGVDCIDNSFPGTTIFANASIYDTEFHKNRLLIATNQGTYISSKELDSQPLATTDFELISGLEAQTWSIQSIDSTIFIGHDFGAFYLDEHFNPVYVNGTYGIWKVIPVSGYKNRLLACGYDGLFLIEKSGNEFKLLQKVESFNESTQDIFPGASPGEFWVAHGYKGIFQIKLNNTLTQVISRVHFTDKNGLPSIYGINISHYNGENIFLTKDGPYTYVDSTNQFSPHAELQEIFKERKEISILTQLKQTVWFIEDNSLGFYSLSSPNKLNKDLFSSLDGTFITGMEHLYPLNSQTLMVGTNTGLHLYKHTSPIITTSIPTTVTSVSYLDNTDTIRFCKIKPTSAIRLEHDISSLRFTFSAPQLSSKKDIQYRYKLDNFDNSWSDWTKNASKEFSFLTPGEYSFLVEAKDNQSMKADMVRYPFGILPPWYQTNLAIFTGTAATLVFLLGIFLRIKRGYNKSLAEQNRIRKVLELELKQANLEREKKNILKDNTILADNIIGKNKELANYTLLLAKNQDLLIEVKDTLNEIKKDARLEKTKTRIRNLAQRISTSLKQEEHLKLFDTHFEKVHQSFFSELKIRYPDLTQKELRLCGFVKMNISNKEIASVLNISLRGVETARYRLKKHLNVEHDINFVEFLDKLPSAEDMDHLANDNT